MTKSHDDAGDYYKGLDIVLVTFDLWLQELRQKLDPMISPTPLLIAKVEPHHLS
jgi:hypothetical protein